MLYSGSGKASLRRAHAEDLPELIELARRSWLSAFGLVAPYDLIAWWVRHDRAAEFYRQHWSAMQVLVVDELIAGILQVQNDEINGLWISPTMHRCGHGTYLLHQAENEIAANGYRVAWLHCSAFNPNGLSFYRRRGYAEVTRHRYVHKSGIEVEDIRLERVL
jgi:ribosomal-protein-alanine N-acetyltransferase